MATLIDSVGTQHYANKMVLAENRKVGNKSLPSALADVDNLIEEMKELFEGEYGSSLDMKLENNDRLFSVGSGSGVDKRNEVENSFTDVEVFGNSVFNMVQQERDKLYSTSGSGRIDKQFTEDGCIYTTRADTSSYLTIRTGAHVIMKPNTDYTLIFTIVQNTFGSSYGGVTISGNGDSFYGITGSTRLYHNSNFSAVPGQKIIKFTTPADITFFTGLGFGFPNIDTKTAGLKFEIKRTILLEGDYTNKPIPSYFKGIRSIGERNDGTAELDILSSNINFFDIKKAKTQEGEKVAYTTTKNTHIINRVGDYGIYVPFYAKAGQTLVIDGGVLNVGNIRIFREFENFQGGGVVNKDFNGSNTTVKNLRMHTFREDGVYHFRIWLMSSGKAELTELMATINGEFDKYEEYKADKKKISLNEPLRGLPNGVRDSIEKVNGEWKLVRRCGEVVLDETKNFTLSSQSENTIYCILQGLTAKNNGYCISDRFYYELGSNDNEHIRVNANGQIVFWINHSKLTVVDLVGVREWLSQNPTKVVYELATPIIEDIDEVTLQSWKNGTISIDEILPVETTHTVALNKPAQIKRNIEELTELRNKVQALENQYDQIALEQAHKLELLNHSFELDYNI